MLVASVAVFALPESQARKWVVRSGVAAFVVFGALVVFFMNSGRPNHVAFTCVLSVLYPNMNTLVLMPMFAVLTAYLGVRRPYSTYEYLLNECYQCGKCHTVCPVTKVEDDALGGLNLVYNTFKKQHDGVPLWTCLACDACSAVCPLDISTATTSSRNGRRSTLGWRRTEGAANDGDRVRTRPHDSPPGHVPRARQRGGRPDGPRDQGRAQVRVRVLPGLRRLLRRRDAGLAHELRRHESRDHLRFVGQAAPRRRHPADDPGPIVHEVLRPRPTLTRHCRRLRADAGV